MKKPRLFYGWYIFGICFLMVCYALGFNGAPRSLFLTVITEDLGIPRSLYSLNDSVRYITKAALDIFFGALVLKFGARKLIAFGFFSLLCSALCYAFADNLFMFYLGGFFLGIGLAWTTTTIVGHLVENWFAENKGTIMGIILAANGLGSAAATQLFNYVIHLDTAFVGWRLCYVLMALGMCLIGLISVLVIRNRPQDLGLQVYQSSTLKKKAARGFQWEGIPFAKVKRKPSFYVCCIAIFLTGMALQSIYGTAAAHMQDSGISSAAIAGVLSISSLLLMISKMSTGFIYDRCGLRATMIMCTTCAMLAIACLAFVSNTVMAYLYCLLSAFALPLETIMLPLIAKELYGSHSFSKIMGLFVAINTFGYAVGIPLMNFIFDSFGTYFYAMLAMAGVMALTGITMQLVITASHKERNLLLQSKGETV